MCSLPVPGQTWAGREDTAVRAVSMALDLAACIECVAVTLS